MGQLPREQRLVTVWEVQEGARLFIGGDHILTLSSETRTLQRFTVI